MVVRSDTETLAAFVDTLSLVQDAFRKVVRLVPIFILKTHNQTNHG